MSRKDIKSRLLNHMELAAAEAAAVRECPVGELTPELLAQHLHAYICFKLLLNQDESRDMDIDELTEASAAARAAAGIPAENVEGGTCDAVDSASMKKALLMQAIRNDFETDIDPLYLVFSPNTTVMAHVICLHKAGLPCPSPFQL